MSIFRESSSSSHVCIDTGYIYMYIYIINSHGIHDTVGRMDVTGMPRRTSRRPPTARLRRCDHLRFVIRRRRRVGRIYGGMLARKVVAHAKPGNGRGASLCMRGGWDDDQRREEETYLPRHRHDDNINNFYIHSGQSSKEVLCLVDGEKVMNNERRGCSAVTNNCL